MFVLLTTRTAKLLKPMLSALEVNLRKHKEMRNIRLNYSSRRYKGRTVSKLDQLAMHLMSQVFRTSTPLKIKSLQFARNVKF